MAIEQSFKPVPLGVAPGSLRHVYCHSDILESALSKLEPGNKFPTTTKIFVGLLIIERLRDTVYSASPHPVTERLRELLSRPISSYRFEGDWLTSLILGQYISTPEYQLISLGFVMKPQYFELLDQCYKFSNSKYVIDQIVEQMPHNYIFMRHMVDNLEYYG